MTTDAGADTASCNTPFTVRSLVHSPSDGTPARRSGRHLRPGARRASRGRGLLRAHQLGLDRVLLVVAGDPWQKHGTVVAPAEARFEMVAAAIDGVDGLEASRIEIDRPGPTYTIDTVEDAVPRPTASCS